jgi:hypothetical protein
LSQVFAEGGNLQGLGRTAAAVEKCNQSEPSATDSRWTRGDTESGHRAEFALELADLVAEAGGFFEPEVARGVGHLVLQRLDEPPEVVGRHVGEVEHR